MTVPSIAVKYCNGQLFFRNAKTDREKIDNVRYWATAEIAGAFLMYVGSGIPKRIISVMPFGFVPGKAIECGLVLISLFLFAHGAMHFVAVNHSGKFQKGVNLLKIQDHSCVPKYGELLKNMDAIELGDCTASGEEVDLSKE